MSSPNPGVEYKNPSETVYANLPLTDVGAAQAVASTTDQPISTALVNRFINEIRFFSKEPGRLAPKGLPLGHDYQAERLQPLHKFHSDQASLVNQARGLAVLFLEKKGAVANAESFVIYLNEKVPDKTRRDAILQEIATLNRAGENNLVQYFDMVSRQRFVIEPGGDGLFYSRVPKFADSELYWDLVPYDTAMSSVALADRPHGVAIWVQGPSGRFYSSTESEPGKFHHSSFLAGRDVKAAGDWKITHGKLELISAMSGHYKPPLEALQGALRDLARTSKALIASAKVQVVDADDHDVEFSATDFCDWKSDQLSKYTACGF